MIHGCMYEMERDVVKLWEEGNDYKIHVFEISWLTDERVVLFQSDFRAVAEFFTQIRKNDEYKSTDIELKHVDEVLKILAVFGEADKFAKLAVKQRKNNKIVFADYGNMKIML